MFTWILILINWLLCLKCPSSIGMKEQFTKWDIQKDRQCVENVKIPISINPDGLGQLLLQWRGISCDDQCVCVYRAHQDPLTSCYSWWLTFVMTSQSCKTKCSADRCTPQERTSLLPQTIGGTLRKAWTSAPEKTTNSRAPQKAPERGNCPGP